MNNPRRGTSLEVKMAPLLLPRGGKPGFPVWGAPVWFKPRGEIKAQLRQRKVAQQSLYPSCPKRKTGGGPGKNTGGRKHGGGIKNPAGGGRRGILGGKKGGVHSGE